MLTQELNDTHQFSEDLRDAFQGVRGALTELLASVAADPEAPQVIAREFGLNRTFAWQLAKIVNADEPHAAVQHIPRAGSLEIILRAFENHGAPPAVREAARSAVRRYDEMVAVHAGDRPSLELMLSSMSPEKVSAERVEAARRQAFLGNSGIWGVQAKVRLASYFLAPNKTEEGMLDSAVLGGLLGVRRLRHDTNIPLFMRHQYNDDGSLRTDVVNRPIDADAPPGDGLMLIREFCSPPLAELRSDGVKGATYFELPPGPVGNTALMDWVCGWHVLSFACMYRDDLNSVGEHPTQLFVPVESLICDLHVHQSLSFAMNQEVALYGQLTSGPMSTSGYREGDRLPIRETVHDRGSGLSNVATPLIPNYVRIVQRVYDRVGWDAKEFRTLRVTIKYPPIPSVLVLRMELPERP